MTEMKRIKIKKRKTQNSNWILRDFNIKDFTVNIKKKYDENKNKCNNFKH